MTQDNSYKVRAYCQSCNRYWTTKKKSDASSPSRCKFCDSSKTKTKSAWTVKS